MAEQIYPKIGSLKDLPAFRARLQTLAIDLPCDDRILSAADGSPLARPIDVGGFGVGNRWCIHPMEGWDGTTTGQPTEHTLRRWQHFGQSGAKLIWGAEAFAVQSDGRANPNQLAVVDNNFDRAERGLAQLLTALTDAHRQTCGTTDDLLVGLQLTHSGRFSRPNQKDKLEPRIVYHHPLLDSRCNIRPDDDSVILSDDDIERLIDSYISVAKLAQRVGFRFVDLKHCHGYLGHEFLSALSRKGRFGGSLENRTRFARQSILGIQAEAPGLLIGVRLSAFDYPPFKANSTSGAGIPEEFRSHLPYHAFGCNPNNPLEIDLSEPIAFIQMLHGLGVRLINASAGSPYYNPHILRPAIFPPSDGYQPPEDPLVGVARQIHALRQLKAACPNSLFVGSGYTYLQEYLPQVAQAALRNGWTDFVGIGRMVLSYWDMPRDTLAGRPFQSKRLCRTFSDCTTAPRNGLISGCYPLDECYKLSPQSHLLKQAKARARNKAI
jgi:2,4-dienoyl-CoA reductase-like NADH-dependent reductase (Old Yellow Enzyme family)